MRRIVRSASSFPSLFGGGEARLVMTGEEILDAGVEVRAQPPGKRNVSIHLLSGGEKALTAIALVFALFQLNPAPFCLLDEVDAPLDDTNTERFCSLVRRMSRDTQFLFISHNKITMELAAQLIGVTMPEQGVSRVVAVDIEEALRIRDAAGRMSDLQLGLIVLGLLVVAAVVTYNKWQERKLGRRHQAAFGSRHEDVLLREPAPPAERPPNRSPRYGSHAAGTTESSTHWARHAGAELQAARRGRPHGGGASARCRRCSIRRSITSSSSIARARSRAASSRCTPSPSSTRACIKPVHWEGHDEQRAHWGARERGGRYLRARAGLQLTNRAGPVTEAAFARVLRFGAGGGANALGERGAAGHGRGAGAPHRRWIDFAPKWTCRSVSA